MTLFQRPRASVARRDLNMYPNRDRMPRMSIRTRRTKRSDFSYDQRRLILILLICSVSFIAIFFGMWVMYKVIGEVASAHPNVELHGAKEKQKALRSSGLSVGSDVVSHQRTGGESFARSDVGSQPAKGAVAEERQCSPIRSEPNTQWKSPAKVDARLNRDYRDCLPFTCEREDYDRCDTTGPTDYDGPDPPCCVHILRDMAKAFDDVMCELGLEYFSSYGTLLGLVRSGRLIPWTGDNDFIVPKETMPLLIRSSFKDKEVFKKHGIHLLWDYSNYRVCTTPTFAGGKLAKSWRTEIEGWYPIEVPFSDVLVAHEEDGMMVDEFGCAHPIDNFRPASRIGVYDNSFHVSIPRDPEAVLANMFGPEWKTPDKEKHRHQTPKCLEMYDPDSTERRNPYAGGGAVPMIFNKGTENALQYKSRYQSEKAKFDSILKSKQDQLKLVTEMAQMYQEMGDNVKAEENLAVGESVLKEIRATELKISDLKKLESPNPMVKISDLKRIVGEID